MTEKKIKISAPGSSMLLGEHAVLYGYPAIVCALDKYTTITLTPRQDRFINIRSELGRYETTLDQLNIEKPFQFVLSAIQYFQVQLDLGFDLDIQSEFSEKIGFGSSATVTVATVAAITQWLTDRLDLALIHKTSIDVIRQVQGLGSGGDVFASVYGGVLIYRSDSLKFKKLATSLPIHLVYSGNKMPTLEVVKKVKEKAKTFSKLFAKLFLAMGDCVEEGKKAILSENLSRLGQIFNIHQGLQEAIGVNNKNLNDIIKNSRVCEGVLGAKISGSGLGDCVVVLGNLPKNYFPMEEAQKKEGILQIPAKVSKTGVKLIKN